MNTQTSGTETEKPNGSAQEQNRSVDPDTAEQAARIAEALEQMKKATQLVYEALGSLGSASGDMAKHKLAQSKLKAEEWENRVEGKIAEKPLLYVGAAFVVGWVLARLSR